MKKLFICETPFQIIVALNIKEQTSNNDLVDLILTDNFNGAFKIADRIRKAKIFNDVFVANVNVKNKFKKLNFVFYTNKYLKKISRNAFKVYDELFFWNYDSFTTSVRNYLYRKNKNLKVYLFEEGYISYFPYSNFKKETFLMKIISLKSKIYKINLSRNNIDAFFLYEPDLLLYDCKIPIRKINKSIIYTNNFKDNIKNIFNLKEINKINEMYDKKYIIFEEYHPEYDDENLFHKIIKKVGSDNVIIKLHPRRKENRFENENVKIIKSDGIPWEAVALLGDFSNKILISIGSGSVTSHRILLGENMHAYLLFKFMGSKLNEFSDEYMKFWNGIESKDESKGVHIPKTLENFYTMLDNEVNKEVKK